MSTETVDWANVRSMVDRTIRAATPPDQLVDRKMRPDSEFSWKEPTPQAGLQAALAVAHRAKQQAYQFALKLRAEGVPWREIADLLAIPWSDQYSRPEQAYQLVLGPQEPGSWSDQRNLYWHCGGPLGCGSYITDKGPYNGHPQDNERGHDKGCQRMSAEVLAYQRESDERDKRAKVMDKAMALLEDSFSRETVGRVRYVLDHGGQYQGWSTGETVAVALVLGDKAMLSDYGYSTQTAALKRVADGMPNPPDNPARWLRNVRAAATGR